MAEHDDALSLTLGGPNGPSSVVLSAADCQEWAFAVAACGNAVSREAVLIRSVTFGSLHDALREAFRPGGAAPHSRAGRMLLEVCDLAEAASLQRRQLERSIAEARLDAMRQLAYGAGHEINNPLANIATRAQSLLPGETDPERRRRIAAIIDQAFRARDMIGGLMVFARPPKPVPGRVSSGDIVTAALQAVGRPAFERGIVVAARLPADVPWGMWDRSQVEEALRAVILNAIEACGEGGRVDVDVVEERPADQHPMAGSVCRIDVVDDGPGFDRDTRERAFDPFFSGREAGRGIGFGLPKAWRLVEINGGAMRIESRPGSGVTVTILLPAGNERGGVPGMTAGSA